jgi:hypothetical protein
MKYNNNKELIKVACDTGHRKSSQMKNRFYFSSYYLQGAWYEIQKHAKINNAEAFGL